VIRIDAAWFAVEPLDMRAGVDTALARVVSVEWPPSAARECAEWLRGFLK